MVISVSFTTFTMTLSAPTAFKLNNNRHAPMHRVCRPIQLYCHHHVAQLYAFPIYSIAFMFSQPKLESPLVSLHQLFGNPIWESLHTVEVYRDCNSPYLTLFEHLRKYIGGCVVAVVAEVHTL